MMSDDTKAIATLLWRFAGALLVGVGLTGLLFYAILIIRASARMDTSVSQLVRMTGEPLSQILTFVLILISGVIVLLLSKKLGALISRNL